MFLLRHLAPLGIAILPWIVGCGPNLPDVVPVTGTVIYQGKPLEGAEVSFLRQDEFPARGTTDAKGRFRLETYVDSDYDLDGAIPGEYVVRVVKLELLVRPEDTSLADVMARHPEGPKQLVPLRYTDEKTSDLRATVSEDGRNDFEFVLSD